MSRWVLGVDVTSLGFFWEDMHLAYMESSTVLRKALNPQIVKTKRSSNRKKDCDQYQRSNPHARNQATLRIAPTRVHAPVA